MVWPGGLTVWLQTAMMNLQQSSKYPLCYLVLRKTQKVRQRALQAMERDMNARVCHCGIFLFVCLPLKISLCCHLYCWATGWKWRCLRLRDKAEASCYDLSGGLKQDVSTSWHTCTEVEVTYVGTVTGVAAHTRHAVSWFLTCAFWDWRPWCTSIILATRQIYGEKTRKEGQAPKWPSDSKLNLIKHVTGM